MAGVSNTFKISLSVLITLFKDTTKIVWLFAGLVDCDTV